MSELTVSPFIQNDSAPAAKRTHPYLVVRFISAVYQREEIALRCGPAEARIKPK